LYSLIYSIIIFILSCLFLYFFFLSYFLSLGSESNLAPPHSNPRSPAGRTTLPISPQTSQPPAGKDTAAMMDRDDSLPAGEHMATTEHAKAGSAPRGPSVRLTRTATKFMIGEGEIQGRQAPSSYRKAIAGLASLALLYE
jgi:hypothetical protein